MHSTLRKALLVFTVATCGVVGGPVSASIFALAPHHPLSAAALADDDNGGDRGHDNDRGRDGDRNGDDRSGHDRNDGNDDRGGDRHNDDNDDNGGTDDNDHRQGRNHAEDDRNDGKDNGKDDGDRYQAQLKVSDHSLKGLLNGSLIAVDNLGRTLEVEVEFEHGKRIVKVGPHGSDLHRTPGPIESVSIRPAN